MFECTRIRKGCYPKYTKILLKLSKKTNNLILKTSQDALTDTPDHMSYSDKMMLHISCLQGEANEKHSQTPRHAY